MSAKPGKLSQNLSLFQNGELKKVVAFLCSGLISDPHTYSTHDFFKQCIYGKPGGPLFTSAAYTAVLHHSQNPDFSDEVRVKTSLPSAAP